MIMPGSGRLALSRPSQTAIGAAVQRQVKAQAVAARCGVNSCWVIGPGPKRSVALSSCDAEINAGIGLSLMLQQFGERIGPS